MSPTANLFKASDAPRYLHGLRNVLYVAIFLCHSPLTFVFTVADTLLFRSIILCATLVLIALTVLVLVQQNKQQASKRVAAGKPAKVRSFSHSSSLCSLY
jgi:hypothetical protein